MDKKYIEYLRKIKLETNLDISQPSFEDSKKLLFFHHEQLRKLSIKHKEETDRFCWEGNIYTFDGITTYDKLNITDSISKMENIYNTAQKTKGNVLEIGFNCGNSSLIFLMANPNIKIYALDICFHSYVKPCVEYLNSIFGNRIVLIEGNSAETIKELTPNIFCDIGLYHIDGCHNKKAVQTDMKNCYNFAQTNSYIILDDTNLPQIQEEYDLYLSEGKIINIPIIKNKNSKFSHKIGVYLKSTI